MSDKKKGLYVIADLTEGKSYVGSSVNLNNRLIDHNHLLNKNKHHNWKLQRAFNKKHNLVILPFPINDDTDIRKAEQEIIDEFFNNESLLNISKNVSANMLGRITSEETKEKQRQAKLGTKQSPETIEKRRQNQIGSKRSEETKERMKVAQQKVANLNNGFLGKNHSDETKSLMRQIALSRNQAPSKEALNRSAEVRSIAVIIDSIEYKSIADAAKALNVSTFCITNRIKSNNFPTYKKKL